MAQSIAVPAGTVTRPAEATAAPAVSVAANPAPLGLAGFAMTTLVLSVVNAGIVTGSSLGAVLALALAYGGLGQLLAGMWEFRNGNTFGATAFTSYGAFWVSFAAFAVLFQGKDASGAVGWFLLGWAIFTFYMWIATLTHPRSIMLVFLLLWVAFALLAVGAFNNDAAGHGMTQIGGYVGILTAIAAWYASARTIINEAFKREILPG